jgi:hypothetical protein
MAGALSPDDAPPPAPYKKRTSALWMTPIAATNVAIDISVLVVQRFGLAVAPADVSEQLQGQGMTELMSTITDWRIGP